MSRLLIVLFCYLIGVQAKCFQTPVGKLPEGCKIGNLTVTAEPSYEMINNLRCNNSIGDTFFNHQPQSVAFQYVTRGYSPPVQYLLTAVDVTSKNLIWMVSNLTIGHNLKIIPYSNGRYTQEMIPWRKPSTSYYSPKREIEYLIFEEHRSYPAKTYLASPSLHASPFNLSIWINSQLNSGITLCGPVGGGSAVATQPSSAPTQAPSPNTTPYHYRYHRRESNSNRNKFDGVLLAGLLLIFVIFGS